MLRSRTPLVAAALALSVSAGCGAEKQKRPVVVSTFPADGQFLTEWLAVARVTFDGPVTVLNEDAASCEAEGPDGGRISMRVVVDRDDPASVLLIPTDGGHFVPGAIHEVSIGEGAVVNAADHYALDEVEFSFLVGLPPNLFLTAEDGAVHEVNPRTGGFVSTTLPPAGLAARSPFGTDERVWVWLDPVVPGSSALGTFLPGDAVITEIVALSGELGVVTGGRGMVLSEDGRTLYVTAEDAGTNRAFVHRVDVPTRTEVLPSLPLSPSLAGSPATFRPALDVQEDRLFVPFSDGAGGGLMAIVDLDAWAEMDVGPAPGVDALPIPAGAGDAAYEWNRDDVFMVLSDETTAGIVRVSGDGEVPDFAFGRETIVGRPTSILPLPDGVLVLSGLDGYVDREGVVRTPARELDDGEDLIVDDDVGAGSVGADRVVALLLDPTDRQFFVVAENGATTVLVVYEWSGGETPTPVDFDDGVDGSQGLDLGPALGGAIATGATTLTGAFPP